MELDGIGWDENGMEWDGMGRDGLVIHRMLRIQ